MKTHDHSAHMHRHHEHRNHEHHHHETHGKGRVPWYRDKFYLVILAAAVIVTASWFINPLRPVTEAFLEYLGLIWWAILLGLLIGGIIDRFVPEEYVAKYLSERKKRTIFNAAFLGFIMSACSHGILAIAIELYRKGASVPAVIAFLLASPWANLPITALLFGFFGPKALAIVASALLVAVTSGFIYQALDRGGLIERSPRSKPADLNVRADLRKRWRAYRFDFGSDVGAVLSGAWSLNKMITWWIVIGLLLASFARAFVPAHIFHQYAGPTLLGLLVVLVLATVIEVCSEGSSPLAFELFRQTGAFGNSFVFLMAGVATDYTEIGLIWTNIGRRAALFLPLVTVPQILLLGWLFNLVF